MSLNNWYCALSERDRFIVDYFQVFEHMVENCGVSPSDYRLDREDFFVTDFDGYSVHFKDLIQPLSPHLPDELFSIEEWGIEGNLAVFRIQMKGDLDKLKKYAHLREIKEKGKRLIPAKEEILNIIEKLSLDSGTKWTKDQARQFLDELQQEEKKNETKKPTL